MKSVVIQGGLRLFKSSESGSALYRSGEIVPAGTRILVSETSVPKIYDHRDQQALLVTWEGAGDSEKRYVLQEEYKHVLM